MGAGADYATAMHEQVLKRINDAGVNLRNIQTAKDKIKQDQEEFGLRKKVADAQIKHQEFLEGPEAVQMLKEKNAAEVKSALANIDLVKTEITAAEMENKRNKEYFESLDKHYYSYLEGQKSITENVADNLAGIDNPSSQMGSNQPLSKLEFLRETLPAGEEVDFGGMTLKSSKPNKREERLAKKEERLASREQKLHEETVPMTSRDGQPWQIYKSKVQAALKKEYKMRE